MFEELKKYWEEDLDVVDEDEEDDDEEDFIGLQLMIQDAISTVETEKELNDRMRAELLVPRVWKDELAVKSTDRSKEFYDFLQEYYEELEEVLEANDDAHVKFDEKIHRLESLLRLTEDINLEDGILLVAPPASPTNAKNMQEEQLELVRVAESLVAVGNAGVFNSEKDRGEWEQRVDVVTQNLELLLDGLAEKKGLVSSLSKKRGIEEIVVEQRKTDLCIDPYFFQLLVRHIGQGYRTDLDYTSDAMEALQCAAEAFLIEKFHEIEASNARAITPSDKPFREKKLHVQAPTTMDALATTLANLNTQSSSTVCAKVHEVSPLPVSANTSDSIRVGDFTTRGSHLFPVALPSFIPISETVFSGGEADSDLTGEARGEFIAPAVQFSLGAANKKPRVSRSRY